MFFKKVIEMGRFFKSQAITNFSNIPVGVF
jgi:hypothetical protein